MNQGSRKVHLHLVGASDSATPEIDRGIFDDDESALAVALGRGDKRAQAAFFDRYQARVQRVLARILGVDSELGDLLHEVFIRAFRSVHRVKNPRALADWLTQIAVCTAMDCLRARRRRRWLTFLPAEQIPERAAGGSR